MADDDGDEAQTEAARTLECYFFRSISCCLSWCRLRRHVDASRLAAIDAQYVRTQSLFGDIKLILATLRDRGVGVDQVLG
jgi:hypothetical protein